MKSKLLSLRAHVVGWLVQTGAEFVVRFRPRDRWYWDARRISRVLVWLSQVIRRGVEDPSLESRLLHRFIDSLSLGWRRFPIPTQPQGMELVAEYLSRGQGLVICAAHVPFVKLFIPHIRQMLGPGHPLLIISKYPDENGVIDTWNDDPIPAIKADGSVLLRTRSHLRQQGCLLLLVDKEQGEYISSNIFRFVGKVGSYVLMCFPQLLPDGKVFLQMVEAPAPECRDEAEVRENLDFIARNVHSILAGDAPPERIRKNVLASAAAHATEQSREVDRIQLYSRQQLVTRARRLKKLLADPDIRVADRELYERRLQWMEAEFQARARNLQRSELTKDGRPLHEPGELELD